MSHRSLVSLVLAAALLAGQWLSASHETEHSLLPDAAHACAVCVYAHGAGHGALPTSVALAFAGAADVPAPALAATPAAVAIRLHPIRGPPAFLA